MNPCPSDCQQLAVRCSSVCEEPFGCALAHLVRSSLVQNQVHNFNLSQVVTPFGIYRVSQSDRKVVKPRLYKDEVRSIFTRAAVVHIHPGPPPVAARGDHVLEPAHKKCWMEILTEWEISGADVIQRFSGNPKKSETNPTWSSCPRLRGQSSDRQDEVGLLWTHTRRTLLHLLSHFYTYCW